MYPQNVGHALEGLAAGVFRGARLQADVVLATFLTLVADSAGFSFFREDRICDLLGLRPEEFRAGRARLIAAGKIRFVRRCGLATQGYYQVVVR